VVVASKSARKLQPIPPSADWQFHIAEGCPAHCQYCYLAGSLSGPPVTRVYANLPEILDGLPKFLGAGQVTSVPNDRREEGTTFEVSYYTDPLGIEHLTGSLSECIRYFGEGHRRRDAFLVRIGDCRRTALRTRSVLDLEGQAPPCSTLM
jgi:spore photoproduct lyase